MSEGVDGVLEVDRFSTARILQSLLTSYVRRFSPKGSAQRGQVWITHDRPCSGLQTNGPTVVDLVFEECKKSSVSLTELRSGSRRGRLPTVRTKIVRSLVENYGVAVAEILAKWESRPPAFRRSCRELCPSSQQRPYPPLSPYSYPEITRFWDQNSEVLTT